MAVDEKVLEYVIRSLLRGREKDINDFAAQFNKDYAVPDEDIDEIASRQDKLTPNDVMTLLRYAGRDFEYLNDPEPDDNKYMQYIQDAMKYRQIQKMMKEIKHE